MNMTNNIPMTLNDAKHKKKLYKFMTNGILTIPDSYLVDFADTIEELESIEAFECVHTLKINMSALALALTKRNKLWRVLKGFICKTDKIKNLSLEQLNSSQNIDMVIEILREFKNVINVKLFLDKHEYSDDEICALTKYFKNVTNIKKLELDTNYDVIHNIMVSIEFNESIETVNLAVSRIRNSQLTMPMPIPVTHKIKKLSFYDSCIYPGHVARFNTFFEKLLTSNHHITKLYLCVILIDIDTIKIISSFVKTHDALTSLSICRCSVNDESIGILSEALMASNVESLFITDNNIGDEGAIHIANLLRLNKSLKIVHITDNPISYEGMIEILQQLAINSTVHEFYRANAVRITENKTVESAIKAFEEILSDNYTLIKFFVMLRVEGMRSVRAKLENITERNKEIFKQLRFVRTKVVDV